jgi:ABC-type multidrug transport system fused ATPase/permease subunit
MGPWWFWILALLIFGAQPLLGATANIWLRQWADQYESNKNTPAFLQGTDGGISIDHYTTTPHISQLILCPSYSKTSEPTIPEIDVRYNLTIYILIGLGGVLLGLFKNLWCVYGSLTASSDLHRTVIQAMCYAKFDFFDMNPLGQLVDRLSGDLACIDGDVTFVAKSVISYTLAIVIMVILVVAVIPRFLIVAFLIAVVYLAIGRFYIRSSRGFKRLESIHRSLIVQHLCETLTGITTIRAYGDENRFITNNLKLIDTCNRPFIYLWATNIWLSFRLDLIGALVAFFTTLFITFDIENIAAGSAGLILGYATTISTELSQLVKNYTILDQSINHIARIMKYRDIEPERDASTLNIALSWPSQGSVGFVNYSTCYPGSSKLVLRHISFKVPPREKLGIVGRTGAGKSSIALGLFRGLTAEEGQILIDDIDISGIKLQELRSSLVIVPQDPTLFTGTIRFNLDPFNYCSDNDIFTVLRRVGLIEAGSVVIHTIRPYYAKIWQT